MVIIFFIASFILIGFAVAYSMGTSRIIMQKWYDKFSASHLHF